MDKNFEQWIKDNRESLEESFPKSDESWENIEQQLNKQRNLWSLPYLWKAAAIALMAIVSFLLLENRPEPSVNEQENEISLNQEIEQVEDYYYGMISNKKEALQDLSTNQNAVNEMLLKELEKLDSGYHALKKLYQHNQDQQIVNAMILNLQTRIDLLNQQMKLIEDLNIRTNETVNL